MDLRFPNTLSFFAAVKRENIIWCSNLNFNGLYAYDLINQETTYIGKFPNHGKREVGLHSMAIWSDNKIVFLPFFSNSIDVYDFKSGFNSCEINTWKSKKCEETFTCAIDGFEWGGKIFLIPRFAEMPIIQYSISNNIIEKEIFLDTIRKYRNLEFSEMTVGVAAEKDIVYISLLGTNKIVLFNMENETEECIILKEIGNIEGALYVDEDMIVVNADHSLYFYDKKFNILRCEKDCVSLKEKLIIRIKRCGNKIFAVPEWLGEIKVFETDNLVLKHYIKVNISDILLRKGVVSNWRHTGTVLQNGETLLINPVSMKRVIIVDCKNLLLSLLSFIAPSNSIPPRNFGQKMSEIESGDLEEFINYIVEGI